MHQTIARLSMEFLGTATLVMTVAASGTHEYGIHAVPGLRSQHRIHIENYYMVVYTLLVVNASLLRVDYQG